MKNCPNCNAELRERPCASCGWPKSTQPPLLTRLLGPLRRASHDVEEPIEETPRGCCGCSLLFVGIGAGIGYALYGPQGVGIGALVGGVIALVMIFSD